MPEKGARRGPRGCICWQWEGMGREGGVWSAAKGCWYMYAARLRGRRAGWWWGWEVGLGEWWCKEVAVKFCLIGGWMGRGGGLGEMEAERRREDWGMEGEDATAPFRLGLATPARLLALRFGNFLGVCAPTEQRHCVRPRTIFTSQNLPARVGHWQSDLRLH